MSTEQAIQHLNTAKDLLKKPQPFNPDGYDPVKLAQFDYRDNFAWTFYGGDIDATITELNQALFHDTYLAEANALLANLYVIQKQFDKAINYYEEAMALNAADIISPLNQAATLDQSGKKDYAKRIYRSIKKDKRFPYPWLIDILLDNKQTAAEILEKQLRREAEPLWLSLGNRIKRLFQSGLSCILCGNSNLVPYYQNPKTNWQVVHCADCGFYFVSPQPTASEITRRYEQTYFAPFLADAEKIFKVWKEWQDAGKIFSPTGKQFSLVFGWLDSLGLKDYEMQLGTSRKMLDIGCATCGLMAEFINRDWAASGIELSPEIIAFDRNLGFEVVQGPVEQVQYPDSSLHLITMTHVIEHLLNPKQTLQEVYRILAPKGKLFIRTPNCESIPRLIAGKEWFSDPDHLSFFGTKTLQKILADTGFRIIGIKNYVGIDMETYSEVWNKLGFNDIIRARINQTNLGDVALVYAEKT